MFTVRIFTVDRFSDTVVFFATFSIGFPAHGTVGFSAHGVTVDRFSDAIFSFFFAGFAVDGFSATELSTSLWITSWSAGSWGFTFLS